MQRPDSPTVASTAVRPTPWLLLGLALVLAMRALAWTLCRLWEPPAAPWREWAKGVAWDVALVLALFALGRALGASRWPRLAWLAGLTGALAMVLRWLDAGHCFMVRAHWTANAFEYLDEGFAGSLADPRLIATLAAAAATAALLAVGVVRDARRQREAGLDWRIALAVLGIALLPAGWAIRDGVTFPAEVTDARLVPEVNFALKWQQAQRRPQLGATPRVSQQTWQTFAGLGLVRSNTPADSPWPLWLDHLDRRPFPYAKREVVRHDGTVVPADPNLVVTFMESTNALFIDSLSGRYQGLMPETSALSRRMTSVEGFHNTSAPTIAALVTALCSIHPSAHPLDLTPGQTVDGNAAYTCLADVLRARGYRTVFVQAAGKTVTSKEFFLRTHGFDEVYGREELGPRFADRGTGPWGPHDAELVTFTQERIVELEAKRKQDGRPFLLVMLTLDTHEPGMAGPDCQLPPGVSDVPEDAAARRLLASLHCSDKAVGRLGRFLLDDQRRNQTVWLLTADHAMFPDLAPASVYPTLADRKQFTRVPFLLHDPLHLLPARIETLSDTRDIAPTLLHLLGIVEVDNSMTGQSVFGGRREHPFLIGRVGERLAFARTPEASIELPVGEVRRGCREGRVLLQASSGPFTACDLAAWLDWQDGLWNAARLFPPHLYHGADGVLDPDGMAARQEPNVAERQLLQAGPHQH